jgi:hypothetical protein
MIYAIAAALVLALGGGLSWWATDTHWQAKYEALQAADATDRSQALAKVAQAYQDQLVEAQAVSSNNSAVIGKLQNENAAIASDRDATVARVNRLLALASRPAPSAGHLPEAGSGQGTPSPSGDAGDDGLRSLLVSAHDECERNANRLNALSAEITPQL